MRAQRTDAQEARERALQREAQEAIAKKRLERKQIKKVNGFE
jgi:hypothetical protein